MWGSVCVWSQKQLSRGSQKQQPLAFPPFFPLISCQHGQTHRLTPQSHPSTSGKSATSDTCNQPTCSLSKRKWLSRFLSETPLSPTRILTATLFLSAPTILPFTQPPRSCCWECFAALMKTLGGEAISHLIPSNTLDMFEHLKMECRPVQRRVWLHSG